MAERLVATECSGEALQVSKPYIRIGMGSCGIAAGAMEVYRLFQEEVQKHALSIQIQKVGCSGMCYAEPLVEVKSEDLPPVVYGHVTPQIALRILDEHLREGRVLNDQVYDVSVRKDVDHG